MFLRWLLFFILWGGIQRGVRCRTRYAAHTPHAKFEEIVLCVMQLGAPIFMCVTMTPPIHVGTSTVVKPRWKQLDMHVHTRCN